MPHSLYRNDLRIGAFFAAYFAVVGIAAPYFPLYLEHRGLSAFEIGLVLALSQALRVVGPTVWAHLADRTAHRLFVLRATAVASCASFAAIFVPGGFVWVFVVMLVFSAFMTALVPITEGIAATQLRGDVNAPARYGRMRVWGSISFVLLALGAGPLFDRFGIGWQPVVALALLAITIAAACWMRDAPHELAVHQKISVRERLREPRVRWFFLSIALMVFAHGAMYSYLSLHLAQLGYSKAAIGAFWVLGVIFEVVFFFTQGHWFRRFGVFALLIATFPLAALRFALTAELAHLWLVLAFAQALHAATFAVHHSASILTVQRWFIGGAATRGQALYISIGYGIGGTAGSLVAAWLWTAVSPAAAFWSSSAAALLGWWAVLQSKARDQESV